MWNIKHVNNPTLSKFRDLKPGDIYNHKVNEAVFYLKVNEQDIKAKFPGMHPNLLDGVTQGTCVDLRNGTLKYTSPESDCYIYTLNSEATPMERILEPSPPNMEAIELGDRVRVSSCRGEFSGREGIVTQIQLGYPHPVYVKFSGLEAYPFKFELLELIEKGG